MIIIYTSSSCSSCRKVISWFQEQEIPFVEKSIFSPTFLERDIIDILKKSENGTDDIISLRSKIIKEGKIDVNSMTLSQIVKFIKDNPTVLKRPIIVDDHRIKVGYNADEIRAFIPHAKRLAAWACLNCPTRDECEHPNDDED